jgi:hypothetical protein
MTLALAISASLNAPSSGFPGEATRFGVFRM